MSILLGILTFLLVLISLFLIMVILMQKAQSDGGMGGVMGGGVAESTFGADTGNVLSKATINAMIVFFILACGLYLGRIYEHNRRGVAHSLPAISSTPALPPITSPAPITAPAAPASPAPKP